MVIHVELTSNLIDSHSFEQLVYASSCGAIATFKGITRDTFNGKQVIQLEYEAYEQMACAVFHQIAQEVQDKFGIHSLCIVHRLGNVPVGECSIFIAASSPHRSDALQAVNYTIDEVKSRVPIWKKEIYADSSTWKQNSEWIYNSC